ncbi:phosphatase [Streptomyces sp. ICN441]|uniref:protein phosphatase 2C domain-containing protein n=1 Tax=Streptomyces sp. ICN441 TaxID=2558286 RepID=UPI00106D726C|nr:protein phosphatase 2C domain-containing protein [Streptomyces sp. ICN441]TFE47714.1 phosphatase [Streptomyces sp. ICN441]
MTPQMPRQAACSKCPGCEEPLESGDLFCGACGYDLSAVPEPPRDRPAAVPEPPRDRPAVATGTRVHWPEAPHAPETPGAGGFGRPGTPQRPGELPGTDSGGRELPAIPVHFDRPDAPPGPRAGAEARFGPAVPVEPASGGSGPASPDPRAAGHTGGHSGEDPAAPPPGAKLCVACRAGQVDPDGYCEHCGHAQPRERDHMEQELSGVAAVSDRGLRHHRNEDSFAVSATALPDGSPAVIAIVCDGVSSATRPDDASSAAARSANEHLLESLPRGTHPQQAMHEAILAAASAVNSLAAEPGGAMEHDPHRHRNAPACTLVGAVAAGGLLVVGWVGDSRAYWVPDDRGGPPARLTEDDSWAAQMVSAGLMSEAEAYADERAHAITGWLGADAYELEPHTAAFKPDRPGVVVVCTDGLWNYAEAPEEMAQILPPDAAGRPLHGARVLLGHALDGGGHDNVTVAVLPFAVPRQGAGSA